MILKILKSMLFGGIFKHMQDPNLIRAKIVELNSGETGDWEEITGNHALTSVDGDFRTNSNIVFKPASGVPLKAFLNRRTGEIKIFPAIMFEING